MLVENIRCEKCSQCAQVIPSSAIWGGSCRRWFTGFVGLILIPFFSVFTFCVITLLNLLYWEFDMSLVGSKAKKWSATVYDSDAENQIGHLSSEDLKGGWYVIYWWPFSFTGICTSEVLGFQELEQDFADIGVTLIGASCDSIHVHKSWFASDTFKQPLKHKVISDKSYKITRQFKFFNKKIACALRAYVLVNPEGVVMSEGANFLSVAREPRDILATAQAFVQGQGCTLSKRREL